MKQYITHNRSKYYLKIHLILVCKYRKKLIIGDVKFELKNILNQISQASDFNIDLMESDENHIHLLRSYTPRLSISSIVNRLKQLSTIKLWEKHSAYLRKHFWKENTFWSDGYFVCSIGEASISTIEEYIKSQG